MQFRTKLGLVDIPNEEVLSAAWDIAGSAGAPFDPAGPSGSLAVATCSGEARDGAQTAATELVLKYVGFPSLSHHEHITSIIREHVAARGLRAHPNS